MNKPSRVGSETISKMIATKLEHDYFWLTTRSDELLDLLLEESNEELVEHLIQELQDIWK